MTIAEELEALRRLVQRMGTPTTRRRTAEDLELFAHLQPWADALRGQLEAGGTLTPAEAVAVAANARPKIEGTEAAAIGEASPRPADAEANLKRLRDEWQQGQRARAALAIVETTQEAAARGADPLEALETKRREEAAKVRREAVPPLADVWAAAQAREKAAKEGRSGFKVSEVFAGTVAAWMNNWAGPAGRFTAGRTVLIGAASGGGKTTLGNVFACSSISSGLPVLYWQAELSTEEHLADLGRCWYDIPRGAEPISRPMPHEFARLLHYPQKGEALRNLKALRAGVAEWADMMELDRQPGGNECRGLVVLDYLQLLEDPESRSDFKATEAAASTLAQLAAERGLVAVILSQASRNSQTELAKDLKPDAKEENKEAARRKFAENCFAGADVRRVAHLALATIEDPDPKAPKGSRMLYKSKDRGAANVKEEKRLTWRMTASGRLEELKGEDPASPTGWLESDAKAEEYEGEEYVLNY